MGTEGVLSVDVGMGSFQILDTPVYGALSKQVNEWFSFGFFLFVIHSSPDS